MCIFSYLDPWLLIVRQTGSKTDTQLRAPKASTCPSHLTSKQPPHFDERVKDPVATEGISNDGSVQETEGKLAKKLVAREFLSFDPLWCICQRVNSNPVRAVRRPMQGGKIETQPRS